MRRLILGLLATLALAAPVATASSAHADVVTTATFTAIQPADQFSQWTNVWTHTFTVTVQLDGTFSGTGFQDGHDSSTTLTNEPETVTGRFHDGVVDMVDTRTSDGVSWSLTNAVTDGDTVNHGVLIVPNIPDYLLEVKVTAPVFTTTGTPTPVLANHGDCVSGAAHAGVTGKSLAAVAKVVTNVGTYGSATCPKV